MDKWEVALGIFEILVVAILFYGNQNIFGWMCMLGGYHIGKGLYKSE